MKKRGGSVIVASVDKIQDQAKGELSFEQALEKLERIVQSLEEGKVPLAELLAKYEEGAGLLKVCGRRLRDAELKIELLKKEGAAETIQPFDPDRDS